jgi:hypothetical protein
LILLDIIRILDRRKKVMFSMPYKSSKSADF